ncbi:MAG: hypothetical protein J7J78_04125 [Thermoprotei archaeon]|nr:hypothetical protein [Thermoprotei archaeon]
MKRYVGFLLFLTALIMLLGFYVAMVSTISCSYLACVYASYNRLMALLFFFIVALAVLYSFIEYEKISKPLRYMFSGFSLAYAAIHYVTTFTLYPHGVFLEAPFLLRTCALGRCSIMFDWGQVFILASIVPHLPTLLAKIRVSRRIKDKNIKPLE